jgi:hypothetical protein
MKPNNIMRINFTDVVPMVALYNANLIDEEKVKELIFTEEYDERIVIMTQEQFEKVFEDLIK